MNDKEEVLVYTFDIPDGDRHNYLVHILLDVLNSYTYQYIEKAVTGTSHVMVSTPDHFHPDLDGSIDDVIFVYMEDGEIKVG